MKLLIVSATKLEIQPFLQTINFNWQNNNLAVSQLNQYSITVLITGVGAPATSYSLTKTLLSQQFDGAIHVGICGHYGNNLANGDVVRIKSDSFADLGIDNHGTFSDLFQMNFSEKDVFPFTNGRLEAPELPSWATFFSYLPIVDALTVNTATGSELRAKTLHDICPQGIETMESASFMYVSLNEHIPFISLRAISNKVEARNFPSWNIPLAVNNLNALLLSFLQK